ncbi:MAG: hypothetical protein CM15mP103_10090 [Gammaproteobacteria bacterium]|nr:MAG: hypothetical protein CM15mP103_10090 [Gammaproteobacteria bacterium]
MKLTARQEQVLNVIRQYVADTGYPPPGRISPANWASSRPTPPRSTCGPWPGKARSR